MIKFVCIVLLFSLCSCASVTYTKNDEGEETFKYRRFGKQKIDGFTASVDEQGLLNIELAGQEGDAGEMVTVLKNITEIAKKAGGMP